MDAKNGSTQTKRNLESPPFSSSGLELDPDPIDAIEVLHESRKTASNTIFGMIFSGMRDAARQAVEAVRRIFFSADSDTESIIHISKPRYLRRNEDELTAEMKEANEAARNTHYAKVISDQFSQVSRADASSLPEQVSVSKQAKPSEASVGEKSFQHYFSLFQEKDGDLPFSPGYFAFTPECLAYAHTLAKSAIGKTVDKMPNAAEIKAAKALLDGEKTIRQEQEQQEALEARKLEKLVIQEIEKTKLPGQSDFEEFCTMYGKHKSENSPFIIFENSKFLTEACIAYANTISADQPLSGQAQAADYLIMWNRDPARSLENARNSTTFNQPLPPTPPKPRNRSTETSQPLHAWESAVLDLRSLSDAELGKLASISGISSEVLKQIFKGLRIASVASAKKDGTLTEARTEQRVGFGLRVPDGSQTAIDDLQQAQYWLKKIREPDVAKMLDAYPQLKAILQSSQRISQVINEQLSLLAPEPAKRDLQFALKPLPLSSLSDEEAVRGATDFDAFVHTFMQAASAGRNYKLAAKSKYLSPACVAVANSFVESIGSAKGLQLLEADRNRLLAASFLIQEASRA